MINPINIHIGNVNIHPTKTEIKFENEREIWSIISIAVKEALGKFNVAPSIDFDTTDSIDIPVAGGSGVGMPEMPKVTFNPNYNPFSNGGGGYNPQPRSVSRNWKELFDERNEGVGMKNEELDRAGLFGSRIEVEEENKVKMFVDKGSQTFDSQFLTQDDSPKIFFIYELKKFAFIFIPAIFTVFGIFRARVCFLWLRLCPALFTLGNFL